MKTITLTRGYQTIVDDEDYTRFGGLKWGAQIRGGHVYARRFMYGKPGEWVYLHRVILNARSGELVDHINQNGLDNRRANLRIVTKSQNNANARKRSGRRTSKYKGVDLNRKAGLWRAQIAVDCRHRCIGHFTSEIEAALAYDAAARQAFGEHAAVNFPLPGERSCLRTA
jgi:hypothetical protein